MSDPFVAEIRMVGFNFAPTGWAFCNGQLMPISQNTALFSLLGTFYGGDGKTTFALPNLQGSTPIQPTNYGWSPPPGLSERQIGEVGGTDNVILLTIEMPAHTHQMQLPNSEADSSNPSGNSWAPARTPAYTQTGNGSMRGDALAMAGASLPHPNMPPYLVVNFIIALQGVFPPRG